jgi:hypothetical protein
LRSAGVGWLIAVGFTLAVSVRRLIALGEGVARGRAIAIIGRAATIRAAGVRSIFRRAIFLVGLGLAVRIGRRVVALGAGGAERGEKSESGG